MKTLKAFAILATLLLATAAHAQTYAYLSAGTDSANAAVGQSKTFTAEMFNPFLFPIAVTIQFDLPNDVHFTLPIIMPPLSGQVDSYTMVVTSTRNSEWSISAVYPHGMAVVSGELSISKGKSHTH